MQTDTVQKAGIRPKTLLSKFLYSRKIEGRIGTVLILPYLVLLAVAFLSEKPSSSAQLPGWENWVVALGVGGLIVATLYSLWNAYAMPRLYAWRVRVFAQRNDLDFVPQSKLIEFLPDTVRQVDVHHVQAIGFSLPVAGQNVTVFDYTCVIGSGKHQQSLAKSLAVLQLKGEYPHLFLDSKKNGKNHQYSASQKIQLEGDFSKYFDMYMPEGSQAGSLTVFAPDMMQTILDTGKLFDVEIEGNQAVIISDEPAFTANVLPAMLNCAAGLSKEFKQLDRSWKPVFTPAGTGFMLKGQPIWRAVLIGLMPFILATGFRLLPANISHPIKNPPAPVVARYDTGIYGQDSATLQAAYNIADQLNAYTASHPVPDTLAEAHITNTLPSITYSKLRPDIYQFCAKYNVYINGNGPTGASGNIVAYYGDTVDSPELPSRLRIVEWHEEGENCQVIKPVLSASSSNKT